jgi:2-dehydropantoate 2-reductase
MPTPSSPLQIAVFGAGKIGSAFAFHLARIGGHDVTVIARPGSVRLQQLHRDRAIIDVTGTRASVVVAEALDEQVRYDLVIVTLLAHQVDAVLPALQRSEAKCIQFMFNTFHPERLQAAIGVERSAFGMPFIQATLDRDGRLRARIGAGGQKTMLSRQRSVDVFNAAGLPAVFENDMPLWLRCHVPLCVAFESVCVAGERRGGGASWREAVVLARGVHASFGLIKGLGYELYPNTKARIDRSPTSVVAAVLWFMSRITSFRELLAGGKAECRALVDAMVAAAPLAKPPIVASEVQAMKP